MTNANGTRRQASQRANPLNVILIVLIVLVILSVSVVIYISVQKNSKVFRKVTMEAGDTVRLEMFLKDPSDPAYFLTDVTKINTSRPGSHSVSVAVNSKRYNSVLTIVDTVPPSGDPVAVTVDLGQLPDPRDCVTNIVDATPVTVSYKEEPNVNIRGQHAAVILLTDAAGNTSNVITFVTVYADSMPPVIRGARDIMAYVGDEVDLMSGVTVYDTVDSEPTLDVDLSAVNFQSPGTYQITYRARDKSGNTSEFTVSLVLREKITHNVSESVVVSLATDVLSRFTNSRMDDMDVAYAIYRWVKNNFNYVPSSDTPSSWTSAAYDGFQTHSGDAFTCFAVTKALLKAAGIRNTDITTSAGAPAPHYWCLIDLGAGWYHFDPFPRAGDGDNFFMVTDAELEVYSYYHGGTHLFDGTKYPARSEESVQSMVDYALPTLIRDTEEPSEDTSDDASDDTSGGTAAD